MGVNTRRGSNINVGMNYRGVVTGVQKIEQNMSKLTGSINKIQRSFGGLGAAIAGAFAINTISDFSRSAVNAASDLNETVGKTRQIFGSASYEIERFAKIASSSLGLSQRAAMDGASTFAVFGKAAGLTGSDLTKFSIDLVKLSADLASFYNTSPEEAIVAIGAALRGEAEPIRRYGVLLNDATLKQIAFDNGITTSIKEALTPQKKALAANLAIFQQTTDAQGDFSRTSDGLANSTRILNAELENSKAILGQELLPLLTEFVQKVTPALRDLMKYGRAAVGTMSSSDIRKLEEEEKANAAKESTVKLQEQLNNEQQLYNELVKSQSFVITNEEYRDRIRFKAKFNALREEYDMRVRIANESINQAIAQKKVTESLSGGGAGAGAVPIKDQINNLKEFNKELGDLSQKGLSEAQVKALDMSLAISQLNSNLSELPDKLDPIAHSFTNLKAPMSDVQERMQAMLNDMNKMMKSFVEGAMVDLFSRLGEGLFGAARDVEDWGNKMIASFGGFLQQMGAMIMSYGFAMDAFKKAFKSPAVAIAAGAALIAIGAGIKATHENKMNGGAGGNGPGVPSQSFNDGYNFQSRIDGYDIVIVTDRNQRLRNRRG